jgi:O-antigen/teichoic acid export membrane protein
MTILRRRILGGFRGLAKRLLNNPDYLGAIIAGYGLTAAQIVVQVVMVPLYIATLGKPLFGVLMVLVAFANVARLGVGWLSGRMLRVLSEAFSRRDEAEFAQARRSFRLAFLLYGAIAAIILWGIGWLVPDALVSDTVDIPRSERDLTFALIGLFTIGLNALTSEITVLAARKQRTVGTLVMISNLAAFALAAVPSLLLGAGIAGVAASFLVGTLVGIAVCVYWGRRRYRASTLENWSFFRAFRRYLGANTGPYALHGMLSLVLQSDILVIGIIGGPTAAADFVLVWKVAEVVALLLWRLSENLQPELIEMDVTGDRGRLARVYRHGMILMTAIAAAAGLAYAAAGNFIVRFWIGKEAAPDDAFGYALAGGALFWIVLVKLPTILAYALVRFGSLNRLTAIEAGGRLTLTVGLFPFVGYVSPLLAVNLIFLGGLGYGYLRLGRRIVEHMPIRGHF